VSQYFKIGRQILWNPSNGVSGLFMRSAEALAPVAGLPTGLGAMKADECQVDLAAFTAFVSALVRRYEQSNHPILHSLMGGFIATALVLVERGGQTISAPDTTDDGGKDVQVSRHAVWPPGDQANAIERWTVLADQHGRAMPR
jgi:hypothetical protein